MLLNIPFPEPVRASDDDTVPDVDGFDSEAEPEELWKGDKLRAALNATEKKDWELYVSKTRANAAYYAKVHEEQMARQAMKDEALEKHRLEQEARAACV